jgi:mono/diheme cytochrome c family protein
MNGSNAIGCPPLLQEPPGSHCGARPPWPALLALILTAPAVSGCPGHLEELPVFVDAGGTQIPVGSINGALPGKPDAAAAPTSSAAVDAALGGATGASPPPPPVDRNTCAQATEIASRIFTPRCAVCHSGPMAPAGLDLASPGVKARLVNIASKSPSSGCAGQVRATADGSAGVIFNKLLGMGCGAQMPAMGPTLSNQEYWCIKEWLNPGAGGPYPATAGYLPATMQPSTNPPAGGGGKLDGGAPSAIPGGVIGVTCAAPQEISEKILKPRCLPCHGALMPVLGLDLETPGAKARLLGVSAKACANQTLARPDGTGLLFDLVTNMVPPGCGMPMPYGGPLPLTADEVTCLRAWIGM